MSSSKSVFLRDEQRSLNVWQFPVLNAESSVFNALQIDKAQDKEKSLQREASLSHHDATQAAEANMQALPPNQQEIPSDPASSDIQPPIETSEAYQEALERGYNEGFQQGQEAGYQQGFPQGLQEGISQGHGEGYQQGLTQGISEGREQGKQSGYEAGHEEGHAQGLAAAGLEIETQRHLLKQVLAGLEIPLQETETQIERELVALAIGIAKKLIRRELKTDPGQVVAVVREAIRNLPTGTRETSLFLQTDDAELLRNTLGLEDQATTWKIIEDPLMSRGGCRISTDTSYIDATIEKRLATVIAKIWGDERN